MTRMGDLQLYRLSMATHTAIPYRSVLLLRSYDLHSADRTPGGFTRSVTYTISVPAGPANVPYTMTYAYAMVLENGTHNSNQQPLFKATLTAGGTVITCASPSYYLPTFNNAGGGGGGGGNDQTPTGATLDSAGALANGFKVSPVFFLSHGGQARKQRSIATRCMDKRMDRSYV